MARMLEVCVDSVESAVSAARGGAMRLELCANLVIGGTSPDEDLFRMVRGRVDIPIRVLLRPRFGDFLYSEEEFELLRRQVRRFLMNVRLWADVCQVMQRSRRRMASSMTITSSIR